MAELEYWAGKPTEEISEYLTSKCEDYYSSLERSGHFQLLRRSYQAYFGKSGGYGVGAGSNSSTELRRGGEQGELHRIKVNHFRNLIQHVLVMTTNPRPAWLPRATNTDYKSQAQTVLADGVLEYYMRDKRMDRTLREAAEYALVFGSGFVTLEWDASLGDQYGIDPDTGKAINTGDARIEPFTALDVIQDVYKDRGASQEWYIVRRFKNKFDLMAKYPELAQELKGVDTKDETVANFRLNYMDAGFESVDIPVYTFYHEKSDSLPDGRMVIFASSKAVFYDGPLPYRRMPVYRIVPGEFFGSPFGYSPSFDLLAIQEVIDNLYSAVTSNNITFAHQNILSPRGLNISVTQIPGGLNILDYDPSIGKPEPLQLTASSPETYQLIAKYEAVAQTLMGVNSVVRGNPEDSLKSGSALALVAAQALQFNSGLQSGFVALCEDVGSGLIWLLQDYATVPRMAMIVGKHNRPYLKEFKGADIDQISRVTVDVANAVSRTTAGKVDIAKDLLQSGMIKTPDEYLMVLQTGKLEPMTEGQTSELLLIKSENERLREGQPVQAIIVEDHPLHIKEHKTVLSNPESKENPLVLQSTLDHIEQHIALMSSNPKLLGVLGIQALQPEGPGQPGVPTQDVLSYPEQAASVENVTPGTEEAQQPNLPNMPTNPLTGEQYQPNI